MDRDTQFQGFAKAVFREILNTNIWIDTTNTFWREDCEEVIARRAYDLALHVIENSDALPFEAGVPDDEIVARIPDLPVLPE